MQYIRGISYRELYRKEEEMGHHVLSLRVGLWFVRAHRETKTKRVRRSYDEKSCSFLSIRRCFYEVNIISSLEEWKAA